MSFDCHTEFLRKTEWFEMNGKIVLCGVRSFRAYGVYTILARKPDGNVFQLPSSTFSLECSNITRTLAQLIPQVFTCSGKYSKVAKQKINAMKEQSAERKRLAIAKQ